MNDMYNENDVIKLKVKEIINTNEYKNMPVWPIKGSIRVIDDIIVIKYTD